MPERSLPSDRASLCDQLLRQQDRSLLHLQRVLAELDAPIMRSLLLRLREASGGEVETAMAEAIDRLAKAIHSLEFCVTETRRELISARGGSDESRREGLPPALARFLAERENAPGFTWTAEQDPVRGWIVRWKQQTAQGIVRGAGHLCERPYAWIEE